MNLSMWILADRLKEYHPKCSIITGECVIQNARILIDSYDKNPNTVYLCPTIDFFPASKSGLICICQNDYIYLETSSLDMVLNEVLQAFDFYNTWEKDIDALISNECTVQDVIDISSPIFINPLIVGDSAYQVTGLDSKEEKYIKNKKLLQHLKTNRNLHITDMVRVNKEQMKRQKNRFPYLLESHNLPGTNGIVKNLFSDMDNRIGMIILKEEEPFDESQYQLLDILGTFLESRYARLHQRDKIPALQKIIQGMIVGNIPTEHDLTILEGNGWNQISEKYIILISPCQPQPNLKYLEKFFNSRHKESCVFIYKTVVVILTQQSSDSWKNFWEKLKISLKESDCYCGVSHLFHHFKYLLQHYESASTALCYGKQKKGAINNCEDYVVDYIRCIVASYASWDLRPTALERIRLYDKTNATDYVETLNRYLLNERNKALTSRELSIHRNTLIHRIERIEEIADINLDDATTRIELLLAFFIYSPSKL